MRGHQPDIPGAVHSLQTLCTHWSSGLLSTEPPCGRPAGPWKQTQETGTQGLLMGMFPEPHKSPHEEGPGWLTGTGPHRCPAHFSLPPLIFPLAFLYSLAPLSKACSSFRIWFLQASSFNPLLNTFIWT